MISSFRQETHQRFDELESRVGALEGRFDTIEAKVDTIIDHLKNSKS